MIGLLTEMCFLFFLDCKNLLGFCLQGVIENFLSLNLLGILCLEVNYELSAQDLCEEVDSFLFGGSEESAVFVRTKDLTATCEKSEYVSVATFLRYVSDVLLGIHSVIPALFFVQGVDADCLFSVHHMSMARESHGDEELLVRLRLDPLLQVGSGIIDWFFLCDVQK